MQTINRFEAAFLTGKDVSAYPEPRYVLNAFLSMESGISPEAFLRLFAKKHNMEGNGEPVRYRMLPEGVADSFGNSRGIVFEFSGLSCVPVRRAYCEEWTDYELVPAFPAKEGKFSLSVTPSNLLYAKHFLECALSGTEPVPFDKSAISDTMCGENQLPTTYDPI